MLNSKGRSLVCLALLLVACHGAHSPIASGHHIELHDLDGRPLEQLEGRLVPPSYESWHPIPEFRRWSGLDGRFDLGFPPDAEEGPWRVGIEFIGEGADRSAQLFDSGQPWDGILELPLEEPVRLTVVPSARIRGRVVDAEGRPCPVSEVEAFRRGPNGDEAAGSMEYVYGPAAEFEVVVRPTGLGVDDIVLRVESAQRQGVLAERWLRVWPGQEIDAILLVAERARRVDVQALCDGEPVVGATAVAWRRSERGAFEVIGRRYSHEGEEMSFVGLEPGEYVVLVWRDDGSMLGGEGWCAVDLRSSNQGVQRVDFTQRGNDVRGRVVADAGVPAAGFIAIAPLVGNRTADRRIVEVDGSGRFEVRLPPGRYVAACGTFEEVTSTKSELGELVVEGTSPEVVLRVPGGSLHGRLLDAAGEPIVGRTVGARRLGSRAEEVYSAVASLEARTDAQGRFGWSGLASGRWVVESLSGDPASAVAHVEIGTDEPVTIELVEATASEVQLDVTNVASWERGFVQREILLRRQDGSLGSTHLRGVGAAFRLPTEPLSLLVVEGDWVSDWVDVPATEPRVASATLAPGAHIEVLHRAGPSSTEVALFGSLGEVTLLAPSRVAKLLRPADAPNTTEFGPLPSGTYRVRATYPNGEVHEVSVEAIRGERHRVPL